jgi:hypothetical protein
MNVLVARCAGPDVHKDTVMACVRTPDGSDKRRQQVRRFLAFTEGLRRLREWLVSEA